MKRKIIEKTVSPKDEKLNFLSAVQHGDLKKISKYLKQGSDINTRTGRTSSLLYLAIKLKNFSLIEFLLDNGAQINGALQTVGILEGYTALHIASGDNNEKLVRHLIACGADVNFFAADGGQPIHAAVYFQNANIVKILLENGADVNATYSEELYMKYLMGEELSSDCYEGVNLLTHAIIKNNYGLVKLLIENGVDLRNCQQTILLRAIDSNCQEIIQLIINNISSLCRNNEGIKLSDFINAAYPSGKFAGYISLHLACKNGNPFSVSHLIENGGNVNAIAEDKVQPIHLAVMYPNVEIIKILLDNGAYIDALFNSNYYAKVPKLSEWVYSNDITLLTHSIIYGNIDVVKLLLDYDVILKTSHRFTKNIIFYAAASDEIEIIRLILANLCKLFNNPNGINTRIRNFINVKYSQSNYSGYTPLHMACKNKNFSCAELLIENGANVIATAADGAQPIHLALMFPNYDRIIRLLLEKGANVNAKYQLKFLDKHVKNPLLLDFSNNFTLLNYAIFVKDPALVELLLQYNAKVNIKNNLNKTMLMYAVENNLSTVVRSLLRHQDNPDINFRDYSGRTALHYVLNSKSMEKYRFSMRDVSFNYSEKAIITRLLLEAGADVFAMIQNNPNTLIANSAAYRACSQVLIIVLAKQLTMKKDISTPLTNACVTIDFNEDFDNSCSHLRKDVVKSQLFNVAYVCLKNIIRRRGIGYDVNEKDITLMNDIMDRQSSLKRYVERQLSYVNDIVNGLKLKFIAGTRLSYFDIFSKRVQCLAGYARNAQIRLELATLNYRTELDCYYAAFKSKWEQAVLMRKSLDLCNNRQYDIVRFTKLPYEVMRLVFEYIDSHKDLDNLILALPDEDIFFD